MLAKHQHNRVQKRVHVMIQVIQIYDVRCSVEMKRCDIGIVSWCRRVGETRPLLTNHEYNEKEDVEN